MQRLVIKLPYKRDKFNFCNRLNGQVRIAQLNRDGVKGVNKYTNLSVNSFVDWKPECDYYCFPCIPEKVKSKLYFTNPIKIVLDIRYCKQITYNIVKFHVYNKQRFNTEIKYFSSSKAEFIFFKVPDTLKDIFFHARTRTISGVIEDFDKSKIWTSSKLPDNYFEFIGFSHELTNNQIQRYFLSKKEFNKLVKDENVAYNLFSNTGKWAVLITRYLR